MDDLNITRILYVDELAALAAAQNTGDARSAMPSERTLARLRLMSLLTGHSSCRPDAPVELTMGAQRYIRTGELDLSVVAECREPMKREVAVEAQRESIDMLKETVREIAHLLPSGDRPTAIAACKDCRARLTARSKARAILSSMEGDKA